MVYEVFAYVETKKTVDSFLHTTRNFGKKFYTLDYDHCKDDDLNELHVLRIIALAISRDLIYKLRWRIECSLTPTKRKEWISKKKPWAGLYPKDCEGPSTMFYPFMANEDPFYNNIFDEHGFAQMDTIEKKDE